MRIADPVLENQWHPTIRSDELTERPVTFTLLGEKVVLFRTSNGVNAMRDLCIHRGTPLSLGKVKNDEIICPYHGWRYNEAGVCTKIPALQKGMTIPPKACTPVFHCQEQFGIVWVCLGNPASPVPEAIPFLDAGLTSILMGAYPVQASAPRVVENFLDVSHLMFVHEGLLGDSDYPEIDDYRVTEIDGVLTSDPISVFQPNVDGRGRQVTNLYVYEIFSPMSVRIKLSTFGTDDILHLTLVVAPNSATSSTAFVIHQRNYDLDIPVDAFIKFQDLLIEQDKVIVENQKPELLPLDLQAELHLRCDRVAIAYRKKLQELGVTIGTA